MARKSADPLTARVRLRVDELRKQMGMSWSDVARAAGQVQQEVSRFSSGQMRFPALTFLDSLARVFQYTLADLLADELPAPSLTSQQVRVVAYWKALTPAKRESFESLLHPQGKKRARDGSRPTPRARGVA